MRSKIIGTGSYAPGKVITNKDLEILVDTSDKWIIERTGIKERRIIDNGEATSDLATKAAIRAIESAGISPEVIDIIIVATATPDMFFPSTACIVQDQIKACKAFAFDLSAACSGFVFALSVGDNYIKNNTCKTALIIGAETLSTITDWTDRNTCILFGDGAGAVILQGTNEESGIISSRLYSDGRLWDMIQVPGGGSRNPPSEKMIAEKLNCMKMKGSETFKIAVRAMGDAILEIIRENKIDIAEISLLIPHQANLRIITAVSERIGISMDKVMINLDKYGNTSAASIPLALDEAVRENRIKKGDVILMIAFGGGLTWASAAIRW